MKQIHNTCLYKTEHHVIEAAYQADLNLLGIRLQDVDRGVSYQAEYDDKSSPEQEGWKV